MNVVTIYVLMCILYICTSLIYKCCRCGMVYMWVCLIHSIMFKWNRLHAKVSIWDKSRNETSFPSIQNLKFRLLINNLKCGLFGRVDLSYIITLFTAELLYTCWYGMNYMQMCHNWCIHLRLYGTDYMPKYRFWIDLVTWHHFQIPRIWSSDHLLITSSVGCLGRRREWYISPI